MIYKEEKCRFHSAHAIICIVFKIDLPEYAFDYFSFNYNIIA